MPPVVLYQKKKKKKKKKKGGEVTRPSDKCVLSKAAKA